MIKKIKYLFISLIVLFSLYSIYKYIPYKIEYLGHYDKIWAHRNNSIEKAKIASKYFNGIELDLVYNEGEDFLDVNHPPAKSIHLSFSKYVSKLEKQPYLWLDIKNLNNTNTQTIFKKLIEIFKENNYPIQKILVETRFPEALPIYAEKGFMTSYYLPFGLSKMDTIDLNKNLTKIKTVLKNQPSIGISLNYGDYELINKHFPNSTKYLWIIDGLRHRNFKVMNALLDDPKVKIVLVSFRTIKGHR